MPEQYISIGYTKKSHGAGGELKANIEEKYLEDFLNTEFVFLNVQNKPLPFFIENIRPGKDIIMKLEEVDTPEQTVGLTSSEIFLRAIDVSEKVPEEDNGEFTYDKLAGYQLIDVERGEIGPIVEVQEHKFQDLLIVKYEEREIMVPLHEDLIESVDMEAKKISLQLPEGLLDL